MQFRTDPTELEDGEEVDKYGATPSTLTRTWTVSTTAKSTEYPE